MNRLKKIKRAKDWRERLTLATRQYPGTPFDLLFEEALNAGRLAKEFPANSIQAATAYEMFAEIGQTFTRLITSGTSQDFFDIGKALNRWKKHSPALNETDEIRASIIALRGMFPEGKHRLELVNGKIVKRERYGKIAVRDVVKSLENHDVRVDENTRRKIQRELGNDRDKRPGCPKGTRKKPARPGKLLPVKPDKSA